MISLVHAFFFTERMTSTLATFRESSNLAVSHQKREGMLFPKNVKTKINLLNFLK